MMGLILAELVWPWSKGLPGWKGLKNLRRLRERVGQIPKWWEKVVGNVKCNDSVNGIFANFDPYVPEAYLIVR